MHKEFDDDLRNKYGEFIVGADETGRGCWVGPIVGAAVCLPDDFELIGLTDSKKLSEKARNDFSEIIKENAIAWSIKEISADEIDQNGITWANIQVLSLSAQEVADKIGTVNLYIFDQSPKNNLTPQIMFPKADSTSLTVAAASVIAKVYRDDLIMKLHEKYPKYCFDQNKGYIDKNHVDMVNKYGIISNIYRESFNVKGYNKSKQAKLF